MKWANYLKLLKETEDAQLHAVACVYDNFTVNFDASVDFFREEISRLERYRQHSLENDTRKCDLERHSQREIEALQQSKRRQFAYLPGTIVVSPREKAEHSFGDKIFDRGYLVHLERQKRYRSAFILHTYQKKRIEGIFTLRAMAMVLEDLVDSILIPNEISFCLPTVFHFKMGQSVQDYSTIVYWPDFLEDEARQAGVFAK
jgi:hypothetical protein